MSGMCPRCLYDLAAPGDDLCRHCRFVADLDREETERIAKLRTDENEAVVLAQDEAA